MQNQITKQDRSQSASETPYFVQTDCFKEDRDIRQPKHITVFLSKNVWFCLLVGILVLVFSWFRLCVKTDFLEKDILKFVH